MESHSPHKEAKKERDQLGKTIRKMRKHRNLTQEELAHKANINISYMAKIENGYVNVTIRLLIRVANGLDVQVKDLFEF